MVLFYWLDILGTIVFAISGVLVAAKKKMDPIGALVLGVITAVGGGTIRDITLNNGSVFWITDPTDLYVAIVTSVVTMFLILFSRLTYSQRLFAILDAIGLAVFVGIGVNKAIASEVNGLVMVCMGVLTGIGGGILRDVLARDIPMVFRTDVYATACFIGGFAQVFAYLYFDLLLVESMLIGMIITLIIRFCAIFLNLKLPIVQRKVKKVNS